MNDDTDSEIDLEDISLQEEWVNDYCSPAKLWRLSYDIEDGTVVKDDIERAMEYYCYLWERQQVPPRELTILLVTIFRKYLRGRGTLEAAFGFTGKQGVRNIGQRNLKIATDVARYHLIPRDCSIRNATLKVSQDKKLSQTTVEDAWRCDKVEGIVRVRLELKSNGRDFTPGQLKRACKIIDPINRKIHAATGINPER